MKIIEKIKNGNRRTIKILGFIKISYKKQEKTVLLENIFSKKYNKKVLMSYITSPFKYGLNKTHSNNLEAMTAAKIFDDLGYQVDAITFSDCLTPQKIKDYDVVYGFGNPFNIAVTNPKIKTIYYGTGCSTSFSNILSIKKIREMYNKSGIWMFNSGRIANLSAEISMYFSDLIITLGNEFVKNTYSLDNIEQNIKNINCFYYDTYDIDIKNKNFEKIKKNFVYFGSSGALHKGLDIVIDIFKRREDLNLTICYDYKGEQDFISYYSDVFNNKYSNIKCKGFINIESSAFKDLMDNNIAVIFPSVSEGGCVAVLNVMANGGLIPIISENCGLDVGHYGYMFADISEKTVEQYIDKLLQTDTNNLKELSIKVKNETRELYSYNQYKNKLSELIKEELSKINNSENNTRSL